MNGGIYINLSQQKGNTATKACKAQATTNKRQKVFIHGQKKKAKGPPFYIKIKNNDNKVKQAHFKNREKIPGHRQLYKYFTQNVFSTHRL